MSNACYNASVMLRKFFHDDYTAMATIVTAEAEEDYTTLRMGLLRLHAIIETLIIELGKEERRRGLEAVPEEIKEMVSLEVEFSNFISLVKRMREAQNQWRDGDPFDYTEVELAKRMDETEREVDEYLKIL